MNAAARALVEGLPGIKEAELNKLGPCVICQQPLLPGAPTFYRITISRGCFEPKAIQRRVGLAMQIGGALAAVMGPNEDLAKVFDGPVDVVVHEDCAQVGHLLQLFAGQSR